MPRSANEYIKLVLYGFIAIPLALSFLFLGLQRSTVLEFGLVAALGPLMVALGGAIFLKEKITRREQIGIFIAFSGTLITVFIPALISHSIVMFTGNILLLLFLVADSSGVLLAKVFSKKNDPQVMTNLAFIVAAVVIIPITLLFHTPQDIVLQLTHLEFKYHLGVLYMALLSGNAAYYLFVKGEKSVEAGEAGLFFYLHPIVSFPLAVLWLGEKVTVPFIIGAVLIGTGVYIAETRK